MNVSDYLLRFAGIGRLYGTKALDAFQKSHVCVVGIGGVGSWAAEALARSGIGEITLIDLDDICISNTNRQLHALSDSIGKDKVAVMAERIKAINPDCVVHQVEDFVTHDNLFELMSKDFDYVVDCIDSIKAKVALIAHCKRNKIAIVTVGGAGGQVDPTQIQLADLSQTVYDPLLSKVRNTLRRDYNYSRNTKRRFGIDAVYSTEQLVYPKGDGTVCQTKPELDGPMRLDCSGGFGAVTVVTGSFAFVAVSRVLKKLAEKANK
ncbi:MAG TPA: tRNA cyclic N6-threonylcarbamoyladenosine(37) synthase TcdA [Rheinheimera sp.]|uniref:tRNA cyclic N6-threonylcarbamoyladenosine(37) synthase TcdA n=1 Tax=Rheinheimera sp. TaxID=1869214 RepID=UPI002B4A8531|nr:tRNA cyclic N6-threonylcarbamoyladenosine(37) synthase TcdA [Rheinheimera sp.]HJS13664.1 tRNA cyclic N6-threonylcarbamoyladenosine(37) synthase TcdA [Rheinheimera sp.]